jgi:hypothetical protein
MNILDFFGFDRLVTTEELYDMVGGTQYSDLFEKIKQCMESLKQLGYSTDIVPLPYSRYDCYWSDYATTFLSRKHGLNFFDRPYLFFVVYLNFGGTQINTDKCIVINYEHLKVEGKRQVLECFYGHLFQHFVWCGDNNECMKIEYKPLQNPERLDFNTLKNDDTYPYMSIKIVMRKKMDLDRHIPVIIELQHLLERYKFSVEYDTQSVEINVRCVPKKEFEMLYNQIESVIKRYITYPRMMDRVKNFKCFYKTRERLFYFPLKNEHKRDKFIEFMMEPD